MKACAVASVDGSKLGPKRAEIRESDDVMLMRRRMRKSIWRDQAGLLASIAVALVGVVFGAAGAYSAGRGAAARAAAPYDAAMSLRDKASDAPTPREDIVARLGQRPAPERIAPPPAGLRPKIIVIFDDIGVDHGAFEKVMALPGPLTLSFLPYADEVQALADRARAQGHAVMLHLPMEPDGASDPGPNALKASMTASQLLSTLAWNLDRFEGYAAVNNHMGSRFTRNEAAMRTVLSVLDQRGVFFVDSKTSPGSRASAAGAAVGAEVFARDVFLDPDAGQDLVRTQLAAAERIARLTGFVVAICHPRPDTLEVLGPWLTSAPERGFDLSTVEVLPILKAHGAERQALAMR